MKSYIVARGTGQARTYLLANGTFRGRWGAAKRFATQAEADKQVAALRDVFKHEIIKALPLDEPDQPPEAA